MKICQARTTDSQHRHTDSHQGFGSALKFTIQFHAMFLNVVYVVKSDVQIRAAIGSQSTRTFNTINKGFLGSRLHTG